MKKIFLIAFSFIVFFLIIHQNATLNYAAGGLGTTCAVNSDCVSEVNGHKVTCRDLPGASGKFCSYETGNPTDKCTADSDCVPDYNGNIVTCQDIAGNKICSATSDKIPPPTGPPPPCETVGPDGVCESFKTGLGSIFTDPGGFISKVFGILLAASGGIALLLIIRAGYKIMTSQGNPEAVKEGRDQLIAAIVGLLFLIFSLVLLQLIGVDILKIPTLGGNQNINVGATCSSCEAQSACTARGGRSIGVLNCTGGTICCE